MGTVEFELADKFVNFNDLNKGNEATESMAERVDMLEQDLEQLRAMLQQVKQPRAETPVPGHQQTPRVSGGTSQRELGHPGKLKVGSAGMASVTKRKSSTLCGEEQGAEFNEVSQGPFVSRKQSDWRGSCLTMGLERSPKFTTKDVADAGGGSVCQVCS